MNFIFMLTENDKTVIDAKERLKDVIASGVTHIGFKDIGLPFEELQDLADSARAAGAKVYLEVVSLDEDSEIRSAEAALSLGVDYLLGGTRPDIIAPILSAHKTQYYPFPGKVEGHPSELKGSMKDIVNSARRMSNIPGVDGLDLLAYRFNGDVPELMRRVCGSVDVPVIVAGSIDSEEKLLAVKRSGAIGFTVGTAAFQEKFVAQEPGFKAQLDHVTYLNQA